MAELIAPPCVRHLLRCHLYSLSRRATIPPETASRIQDLGFRVLIFFLFFPTVWGFSSLHVIVFFSVFSNGSFMCNVHFVRCRRRRGCSQAEELHFAGSKCLNFSFPHFVVMAASQCLAWLLSASLVEICWLFGSDRKWSG
ncbi:hypothetical protein H6P81_012558 [Aristolochia fimbriata]|uniref:Uncharacterized protein n=1 Tax=Aristolochia fimbriata TaxID=158543 RepID=A0AAV7EC48_ARIFI|nr:hypothetical protein H6P81_012558 [Aristolochia fimbriata]